MIKSDFKIGQHIKLNQNFFDEFYNDDYIINENKFLVTGIHKKLDIIHWEFIGKNGNAVYSGSFINEIDSIIN